VQDARRYGASVPRSSRARTKKILELDATTNVPAAAGEPTLEAPLAVPANVDTEPSDGRRAAVSVVLPNALRHLVPARLAFVRGGRAPLPQPRLRAPGDPRRGRPDAPVMATILIRASGSGVRSRASRGSAVVVMEPPENRDSRDAALELGRTRN